MTVTAIKLMELIIVITIKTMVMIRVWQPKNNKGDGKKKGKKGNLDLEEATEGDEEDRKKKGKRRI